MQMETLGVVQCIPIVEPYLSFLLPNKMNGGVLSAKAVFQLLALQALRVSHMLVKIPGANFQKE